MSLQEHYRTLLNQPEYHSDPQQAHIVTLLETLQKSIEHQQAWWPRFKSLLGVGSTPKGLYLWGGVGRGKTFLMDLFFQHLDIKAKKRIHFHQFMMQVHQQLRALEGKKEPLALVASKLASDTRVLCLDEFFVSDIGDAMLLGGLLKHLFALRVVLVATSNVEPKRLYSNGLQRDKFLPAIALLEAHTNIAHLDGGEDYRLTTLKKTELYHYPLNERGEALLNQTFLSLSPDQQTKEPLLDISGRTFTARKVADSIVWFDFDELCKKPRAAMDYIEIARTFHTVLISNIPKLDDSISDAVRRWINLVDAFYDHRVTLIVTAQTSLDTLYHGKRLQFEFDRTQSRMQEMQSHQYIAKPHLA